MDSLRRLAAELSIPERTLRRAAAEGLLHGRRLSQRRFHTPLREESYLRSHWELLRSLRSALRTEPNVKLAVLFGSAANGEDRTDSDLDILVVLGDDPVGRLADLAGRLTYRLGRDAQLVRLRDAERSPVLMAAILQEGRVLVDREGFWTALRVSMPRWQRHARRAEAPLAEVMENLDSDESASA
ncbi:MAG TPA: nucleotidyltransferase domain-containing protein [Solirubrobacteraceae bacterium]|jgi:predicted nucleotidyltransferase